MIQLSLYYYFLLLFIISHKILCNLVLKTFIRFLLITRLYKNWVLGVSNFAFNLKETRNPHFCVTPKNHWLMFAS